jgi:hypothetical protein
VGAAGEVDEKKKKTRRQHRAYTTLLQYQNQRRDVQTAGHGKIVLSTS